MNIEESISKIKEVIYMSDGTKVDYIDINHMDLGDEVSVDVFIQAIETLLTAYEKEKEKNFKRSDMCFLLKSENTKLKDEVKALENADLTTVYLNGFYDGEKKVKDKIKPIQIIDLDGKIHNVYKIEEE